MDREAELRQALAATLSELTGERDSLDLVEDLPLLESAVEDIARARIGQARAEGASWSSIASRLGVTRQAVHKRFSVGSSHRRGPRFELRLEREKHNKES